MKEYLNKVCGQYYRLNERLLLQQEHFEELMDNPVPYIGQTYLTDIDQVLRYCYKAQKANDELTETNNEIIELQTLILKMLEYIGVPANTKLIGVIPEQVEFYIWADEDNEVHYEKIKDLAPANDDPNIITIKIRNDREVRVDDEDE